jgi:hypothetical protein
MDYLTDVLLHTLSHQKPKEPRRIMDYRCIEDVPEDISQLAKLANMLDFLFIPSSFLNLESFM